MLYVRISFFQVLGDRYPLQSKFALLCISYSRHDTFRLSGRRKIMLTSIVLTNSRLPSPWVTKAVLKHPRGTCTRRNFWRQNGRHGDGDIEGDDGQMTVLSSHVQAVWKWFFENVKNTCIEWLSAWSFSKYVKPPPRFLPFHKDLFFFAPFLVPFS